VTIITKQNRASAYQISLILDWHRYNHFTHTMHTVFAVEGWLAGYLSHADIVSKRLNLS